MYDLVDLIKACAQIARVAANAEGIGVGADLYHFHILLHVAGKPAAVAREHEADSPRIRDICDRRFTSHHHNIRVFEFFCDVFCYVQAVSAAGKAEYYIFAHCLPPILFCIVLC